MSRVHIGEKNGRVGAWVSPAGVDASAEGSRMLLDSDLDNLKPHFSTRILINNWSWYDEGDQSQGRVATAPGPILFPALPFIPLAFVQVAASVSNYGAVFPPGITVDGGSGNVYVDAPSYDIYMDRVVILGNLRFFSTSIYVYVNVFANRME